MTLPRTRITTGRTSAALVATFVLSAALAGCTADGDDIRKGTSSGSASASPTPLSLAGTPTVLADGLESPWSILPLGAADESILISDRDAGIINELTPSGKVREVGAVAGSVHIGEGGLLGLALFDEVDTRWVYAYVTTATDNRIVRMQLAGVSGTYSLGAPQVVLNGLAKAVNHDGGRIAFGPDGMLYASVGDAGVPSRAQDRDSLNGKILRMTPTGAAPDDNPFPGSLVYTLGHRNPQGLAWDADGQLWAAEFGQDTWDEFNRIEPGANYGWPTVEGIANRKGFVDPITQWATDDASPSGLAYVGGTFFLAALKGDRLWQIVPGDPVATASSLSGYGRLRDAVAGPDGTLLVLTNNTDGRGSPGAGDDKLLRLTLNVGGGD